MIDLFSSQRIYFLECRNKKIIKRKTEDSCKNRKSSAENGRVGSYAISTMGFMRKYIYMYKINSFRFSLHFNLVLHTFDQDREKN